jgi:hypothetical protein
LFVHAGRPSQGAINLEQGVVARGCQPSIREMAALLAEMDGLDEPYHHRTVSCRIHYAAAHGLVGLPLAKQERFTPIKYVKGFRAVYDELHFP